MDFRQRQMAKSLISNFNIKKIKKNYKDAIPFDHVVIDNFWKKEVAKNLEREINNFNKDKKYDVNVYDNAIEKKITCNDYDKFPSTVYTAFSYLNSLTFLNVIKKITNIKNLIVDVGLHGGGIHIHPNGGKLNIHKDYSIHPKLKKERRLNLIIYMTKNWNEKWGGDLELWSHDKIRNKPLNLVKKIKNKFNRAILFDTSQNSWHGLPSPIKLPRGKKRQSMAVYYLSEPRPKSDSRQRALFAPTKKQEKNKKILELIKKRSNLKTSTEVYRSK